MVFNYAAFDMPKLTDSAKRCLESYLKYDGFLLRTDLLAHEMKGNSSRRTDAEIMLLNNAGIASVRPHVYVLSNMEQEWLNFQSVVLAQAAINNRRQEYISDIANTQISSSVTKTLGSQMKFHVNICEMAARYLEEKRLCSARPNAILIDSGYTFKKFTHGLFGEPRRFKSFMADVDTARVLSPDFFMAASHLVKDCYEKRVSRDRVYDRVKTLTDATDSVINILKDYRAKQTEALFAFEVDETFELIAESLSMDCEKSLFDDESRELI